jgi:hypothetical protein
MPLLMLIPPEHSVTLPPSTMLPTRAERKALAVSKSLKPIAAVTSSALERSVMFIFRLNW